MRGVNTNLNISNLRNQLDNVFNGSASQLRSGISVFVTLISSNSANASSSSGVIGFFLFVFIAMAIIWSLGKFGSKEKISVKDAFYKGISPIVQFILVLLYLILLLLPFTLGASVYSTIK